MPLEITRSFVENRDGTYDLYETPKVQVENLNDSFGKNQTPIRPFELKTYLKVGECDCSNYYLLLGIAGEKSDLRLANIIQRVKKLMTTTFII